MKFNSNCCFSLKKMLDLNQMFRNDLHFKSNGSFHSLQQQSQTTSSSSSLFYCCDSLVWCGGLLLLYNVM